MNSSQCTDKQIMGRSGSQNNDFFDLMDPQEEQPNSGGKKETKEDILSSYDFKPIRPVGASQLINIDGSNVGGTRVWKSADSKSNPSHLRTYGSLDTSESAYVAQEKDCHTCDLVTVSKIDQTMKKHTDKLLHSLEGVSARLSQLESRSWRLESAMDDLKVSIGNNHGNADGKLRQLENILREVQTGVQFLRDKQEIAEAQLQLAKLQASKGDTEAENNNSTVHTDSVQQAASAPQHSFQPLVPPVALPQPPQPLPALPPLSAPTFPAQQNTPPVPLPSQLPQSQIPSIPQQGPYFPPPSQLPEATHQQYQLPPVQQPQLPSPAPNQHYQLAPQLPQYSQPPQLPQQHPPVGPVNLPPQPQPPLSHHPEETPYMLPQSYPPSNRQLPATTQPPAGAPPSQQFYGAPPHMYELPSSRPSSGFSSGYGVPSEPNSGDSYPYSGIPSRYGSSAMKPPHLSSSSGPSDGSSYPRLPTAQILPHALPTASSDSGGSSSGGNGNRVPIDDVVDKVALMGFSRDQVRATVRRLTENGQSVDLNVVLDKLMNDGEVQPPKGWFGR